MDEPTLAGDIPSDLQGQVDQLRAVGTPECDAAAEVYQEVIDGKLTHEQARSAVDEAMLLGGGPWTMS
jgi:hypothetical protein